MSTAPTMPPARSVRPAQGLRPAATSDPRKRSLMVSLCAAAGLTLLLGTMLARVAQLQLAPGKQLTEQRSSRVTKIREVATRGDLIDRTGRALAVSRTGFRVAIDPTILKRDELDANILRLATAMDADPEKLGLRLYETIRRNDEIIAANPEPEPEPSGIRGILVGFTSTAAPETAAPAPDLDDQHEDVAPTKPLRYLILSDVLTDEQVAKVRALKITGLTLDQKPLRDYPSGDIAASIVGLAGAQKEWGVGAERRLDEELTGEDGSISYTRDRFGKPLWMERGQVQPSKAGDDVRLSIDMELQRIAYEELMRGIEDADAAGGRCILLDPLTGEILAMVDIVRDVPGLQPFPWVDNPRATPEEKQKAAEWDAWRSQHIREQSQRLSELGLPEPRSTGHPRYITMTDDPNRRLNPAMARNRCIEDIYEPGSTFKAFVWSVITEMGVMRPEEVVDTEGGRWVAPGGRPVSDVHEAKTMTWSEVLVHSSNIGMIKGALKITPAQLRDVCVRFGFGKKTGIELPGEASGIVTSAKAWGKLTQSSVAHGYEIAVTPIQMARAFSAFARPGELAGTLPQVHLRAIIPEGGNHAHAKDFQRGVIYRVLPSDVAVLTRQVMAQVAENAESKMKDTPIGGWRYTMFGKSGTAEIPLTKPPTGKMRPRGIGYFDGQYNSSFIAAGPTEAPRLVVLTVIDDPGPKTINARKHYGSWVAAPVVRRVMERSLTYLGTSPSPVPQGPQFAGPVLPPGLSATPPGEAVQPPKPQPKGTQPAAKSATKATPKGNPKGQRVADRR